MRQPNSSWFLLRIVLVVLLLPLVLGGAAPKREFYVAPTGNDSNPGTKIRPVATLQRARDAIRSLKETGSLPGGAYRVWVRGGSYFFRSPLVLAAEDSGTQTAPIAYQAAAGEEVRLTRGKEVTGFVAVTDEAILGRMDSSCRGNVLQADLRKQGITDFGQLSARGFGLPTQSAALELFFQDKPMTLARWPNQGFVTIDDVPNREAIVDIHAPGSKSGRLTYSDGRPARWGHTGT